MRKAREQVCRNTALRTAEQVSGWAVAADDGGHEDRLPNPFGWTDDDANAGGSAHFGIDEQARIDYGYNGIEKTATISKAIIARYYARRPAYSYLSGCSNGGRDGMVASQRFPELFDGIIVAIPALICRVPESRSLERASARATRYAHRRKWPTLHPRHVPAPGSRGGAGGDPRRLRRAGRSRRRHLRQLPSLHQQSGFPALDAVSCSPSGAHGNVPHGGSCPTSTQVSALKKIFAGPKNSKGEALYSRGYWDGGIWDPPAAFGAGFSLWNVGNVTPAPLANNAINLTLGAGAVPMVFTNPPVVTPVSGSHGQEAFLFSYDFDTDAPTIFKSAPFYAQPPMEFMTGVSLDLLPFKRHGGKLIIYSSVNDGIFSGVDIVNWYKAMNREMGRDADDFARLFIVPNMAHCGGGPATNSFAANMLTAITNWVENGNAPERIIAANTNMASPYPTGGLFDPRVALNFPTGGTRPLCPYPQQSRYKGAGSTADAANFTCIATDDRDHDDNERHHDHDFDDAGEHNRD